MTGRFISFEGGEGTGKSTQIRLLAERLRAAGHEVVVTREPGGTEGAEAIRTLLLNGDPGRWSPVTEALLMNASRADHVERLVRPALERGAWVLSDRYADSTFVYQGIAGHVGGDALRALHTHATQDLWPDLTIVLDLPEGEGLDRALARGGEGRFEAKGAAFHAAVRHGFRQRAAGEPSRCRLIDASGTVEQVAARVSDAVADLE